MNPPRNRKDERGNPPPTAGASEFYPNRTRDQCIMREGPVCAMGVGTIVRARSRYHATGARLVYRYQQGPDTPSPGPAIFDRRPAVLADQMLIAALLKAQLMGISHRLRTGLNFGSQTTSHQLGHRLIDHVERDVLLLLCNVRSICAY